MPPPALPLVVEPSITPTPEAPVSPPSPSLRDALGEEIYEIFTEEVSEIIAALSELYPQWDQARNDRGLLGEIRRGFHTLKGSGRMAGAFALGDFAWAHESLLNNVLGGQLAADDRMSAQLLAAIQELQARPAFFQNAQTKDAGVIAAIAEAEAILAGKPSPAAAALTLAQHLENVTSTDDTPVVVETFEAASIEPEIAAAPEETLSFIEFIEPEITVSEPENPEIIDEQAAQAEQEADTQLIWQFFWEEFPEQIRALDQHLQYLQQHPADQDTLRELEREFHTLKGGARMAQLTRLADISHDAETLLAHLPASGADVASLDTLQQAIDQLHSVAEQARSKPAPTTPLTEVTAPATSTSETVTETTTTADSSSGTLPSLPPLPALGAPWLKVSNDTQEFASLLEQVLAEQADTLPDIQVLSNTSATEQPQPSTHDASTNANHHETIRLPALFVDNLIERIVGLNVQQVRMTEHFNSMGVDVEELGRTVARLRQQVRTLELESEAQIHDGRSQRSGTIAHSSGAEFDPLEMDQYAEIQRISRSLAESLNDLVNIEADLSTQVRKGEQLLQEDMRTTRHIQQDLLDTRLVALTMLVPRLRRLTRQTASELGKQAVLEVEGEECELDRNLLQNMTAPLEHLIRNAVSHGIETPEEREQQGKPRNGRITLSVSRDDAEIIIRFRDDGRGLDRKQLRQRGLELGLIKPQDTLPDNELDRLILRPGFTTAKSISQIAGRGIGMDVVNSELKALGGSLQIESRPQQGVEFIMRLPFTLIVNPVLLAEVEGQTFALPISGIQGLARISGADLEKALQSDIAQVDFADERYSLQMLAEPLGAHTAPVLAAEEMFPVVFYKLQEHNIAWIIGHIQGRREVVLQPLGVLFKDCRLYSAATLSPDGSVFLVPDMAELARRVSVGHAASTSTTVTPDTPSGTARVLVVDDSITVRRVTEKFLHSQEYTVSTAKDGMDALEQIGEFLPDVILLDIEMPRMDGFELLGHLRRDPQWQRLPVVMISSRTAQRHREHAMSLGASDFLGKPYQNEMLLSTLQNLLNNGHANDGERVSA